jgi:hypothetical protein
MHDAFFCWQQWQIHPLCSFSLLAETAQPIMIKAVCIYNANHWYKACTHGPCLLSN